MVTRRDYYDVLGVDKNAAAAELKAAYRKKALVYHPDRNKAADAEEKFKEVNEAYEVLSNPEKKQAYDQFGHTAWDPRAGRAGPFTYTYTTSGFPGGVDFGDFSDPFEIFESFFGGAVPFGRRASKPHYSLKISLEEAFRGVEKTLIHQGQQYQIKIPAGADDGTRIRYQNFDVSIDVQPDSRFRREGEDVVVNQEIPFSLAALGGVTEVPTLTGKVKIKIRPGTQSGTLVRLRGQGMPYLHGRARGDEYVRLVVTIPKNLTAEQKDWLRRFDETLG